MRKLLSIQFYTFVFLKENQHFSQVSESEGKENVETKHITHYLNIIYKTGQKGKGLSQKFVLLWLLIG